MSSGSKRRPCFVLREFIIVPLAKIPHRPNGGSAFLLSATPHARAHPGFNGENFLLSTPPLYSSFLSVAGGSKNRSNFRATADSGSTVASPKSVESTKTTSANDWTLLQSKRRRFASCCKQRANFSVSSCDIRLGQAESHSIFPSGNGCPHFQHVFIRGSFLFVREIPIPCEAERKASPAAAGPGQEARREKSERVRCSDPLRPGWKELPKSFVWRRFFLPCFP
jgi:hypothetical protein